MQLLYLNIQGRAKKPDESLENSPYRVFNTISLNFSNQLNFKLLEAEISVSFNDHFIPNLFDIENKDSKINSFSAIIGQNGTGKSSIISFIRSLNQTDYQSYKYIAVFLEKKHYDSKKTIRIYKHPQVKLNKASASSKVQEEFDLDNIIYEEETIDFKSLFYSPLLEIKTFEKEFDLNKYNHVNEINISTSHLLMNDVESKYNVDKNLVIKANNQFSSSYEILRTHRITEVERQIDFVYKTRNSSEEFKFPLPKYLFLSSDNFDEEQCENVSNFNFLVTNFDAYYQNAQSTKDKVIVKIIRSSFFHLLRYGKDSIICSNFYELLDKSSIGTGEADSFIEKLIRLIMVHGVVHTESGKTEIPWPLSFALENLSKFIKGIKELPGDLFKLLPEEGLLIDFKREDSEIIDSYLNSIIVVGHLKYNWFHNNYSFTTLSSGEDNYLSLFSRMYHELIVKNGVKDDQEIICLFDEPDSFLHPEWQREFCDDLISYFSNFLPKKAKVQIILTTHSPFIASDLPPYCIIKLKKEGLITKVEDSKESTFGANIHRLFTDSFYLNNGLIGEFSKNFIERLIEEINSSKSPSPERFNLLLNKIQIIGEPYIKKRLLERLKETASSSQKSEIEIIEGVDLKNNQNRWNAIN